VCVRERERERERVRVRERESERVRESVSECVREARVCGEWRRKPKPSTLNEAPTCVHA
jgi:hypothetical protein